MLKNKLTFSSLNNIYSFIGYTFPLALLLWFVATYSVNVPYWDEWALVSIFDKVATGTATFQDFFAQHNEHRILFPKIIFTILAFSTNWDISYQLILSILLAAATFLMLSKISYSQINHIPKNYLHSANILSCILIFSLPQHENWLWGFQIAWFLINFCVATAIFSLTLLNNVKVKILVAAIFCFIATFSLAHGLLSWIAVIPSVAAIAGSHSQKIKRIIFWFVLFLASVGIYFIGYQKPAYHPDIFFFLKQPFVALSYLLTIIGIPLSRNINFSSTLGFIVIANLLFFVVYYIRNYRTKFALDATPWLSFSLFSLLFNFLTTLGRAGFGVGQALSSRYTTHSLLLIIALMQIWVLFLTHVLHRKIYKKNYINKIFNFILVGVLILILFNSTEAITETRKEYQQRTSSQECLELSNYITSTENNCLKEIYPDVAVLKLYLGIVNKLGFRRFTTDISFAKEPQSTYGYIDIPPVNNKPITINKSQNLPVIGWSLIPAQAKIPKLILLSYNKQKSFFATAYVKLDRPDVAKAFNSSCYSKAGWEVNLSLKSLPLQEIALEAWVYDTYKNQFVQIKGEPKIKVVE